jgi:hypothetical protein
MQEAGMQDTYWQVRRTPDGCIDYASYKQAAQAMRRSAMQTSFAHLDNALRTDLAAAVRMAGRAARLIGTAAIKIGGHAISFWMIPPLGPADRLSIHHVED